MQQFSPRIRLAIDCSSTRTCDFNSGIQRVVRSLCDQSLNSPASDVFGIPVHGVNGNWYFAKSLWPKPCHSHAAQLLSSNVSIKTRRNFASKVARELGRTYRKLTKRWQRIRESASKTEIPIEFCNRDVLLMADASWMTPNWEAVHNAKSNNAKIGLLIYDLLPIINPELFPPELVSRFHSWFDRAIVEADFIVCISQSVASSVVAELGRHDDGIRLAAKTYWFPLGANLKSSNVFGLPSPKIQSWFNEKRASNPCLVVGTLEPRKNHNLILDAFEERWKDHSQQSLCILGRIGWNCNSLLKRICEHREFGRKLFLNTEATDEDVHYAYSHARAVIMASKNEGYGLPIVEGLGYRQIVLASDIAVHREVGRDRVHYFAIDAGHSQLCQLLSSMELNKLQDLIPAEGIVAEEVTSWEESYEALCQTILVATHEMHSTIMHSNRAA